MEPSEVDEFQIPVVVTWFLSDDTGRRRCHVSDLVAMATSKTETPIDTAIREFDILLCRSTGCFVPNTESLVSAGTVCPTSDRLGNGASNPVLSPREHLQR